MNQKIKTGIIGFITLLLGFGGSIILKQVEVDNGYVCNLTKEFAICMNGISKSGYSCYPVEGTRKGVKRCGNKLNKGNWIDLTTYVTNQGISIKDFLESTEKPSEIISSGSCNEKQKCSVCDQQGCIRI